MSTTAPVSGLPTVSGPAYGRGFRWVATALMAAVLVQAVRVGLQLDLLSQRELRGEGFWILVTGLIALVGSYVVLMRSRTTIDADGIRQSGLLEKRVAWRDVAYTRFDGLGFARRLRVRTALGGRQVFFGGTPELVAAFERIAQQYPPPR